MFLYSSDAQYQTIVCVCLCDMYMFVVEYPFSVFIETWQQGTYCLLTVGSPKSVTLALQETLGMTPIMWLKEM